MAFDKRFGIDIPSEKQQLKEWSAHKIKLSLQEKIVKLYRSDDLASIALGLKHLIELNKMQKYYDPVNETHNNNLIFVTKYENRKEWEKKTREHAKKLASSTRTLESELAADT